MPSNLSNLRCKVDKLNIDKLEFVSLNLSKLNDVVKNDVVKKTEYNQFVKKVNYSSTTDTINVVKETDYNTKINEIEHKINDHGHDKYITIQRINKLTADNFTARLKLVNLANKNDIATSMNKVDFYNKQ